MSTPIDDPRLQMWLPDRDSTDMKRMLDIANFTVRFWNPETSFHSPSSVLRLLGPSGVCVVAWDGGTPLFALMNCKGEAIPDGDDVIPRVAFTPSEIDEFTGIDPFYLPGCGADVEKPGPASPDDLKPLIEVLKRRLSRKQRAKLASRQA
ncbi:hypothetical protein [Variovorax rhizosphaerae]|uniref:Uncharacterized protein n=1 Tax=Variovorax rhizosphaerae TaxID=1836200 RepID=A0ABU8WSD2_9BURK